MKIQRLRYLAYLLPLTGVGFALHNSWRPYSYWADELGSVSMGLLMMPEVMMAISTDVHPPLFQLILKIWIQCFGSGEPIVRLFSLSCCLAAITYLFIKTKNFTFIGRWTVTTSFATSFLFSFYAQEARSYALTLLLATITTVKFTELPTTPTRRECVYFSAAALTLSLTHYFGLLLALTTFVLLSLEHTANKRLRITCLVSGGLCLIWPITHYHLGLASLKASKNAWMSVDGPMDTIRIFSRILLPQTNDFLMLFAIAPIVFGLVWKAHQQHRSHKIPSIGVYQNLYRASSVCALMLAGIILIDWISPISTERNFIVLLPSLSIALGLMTEFLYARCRMPIRAAIPASVILLSVNNLTFAHYLLTLKWGPQQNWRATAQYVVDNITSEKLYYLRNRDDDETDRVFNFYISKLSQKTLQAERIYIEQVDQLTESSYLILGGANQNLFSEVRRRRPNDNLQIFQPSQSLGNTTGVIIIPNK